MKLKIEYLFLVMVILALSMYLVLHKRDKLQYGLPELPKAMKKEITKIQISKQDTAVQEPGHEFTLAGHGRLFLRRRGRPGSPSECDQ